MAYEARPLRRQKVRYNSDNDDNPIVFQLVLDGAKVTPTSGTVAVYAPTSTTAVLSATAMTASGTKLTYPIVTTTVASYPIGTGYRARVVVTYSSKTYEYDLMFDVVNTPLLLNVGRDQLIALDDSIKGMEHNDDEDFSEIIEACRDEIQLLLETKILDGGGMVENMVLDPSRVAIPFRRYVLAAIFRSKGNTERAEYHEKQFDEMFRSVLAGVKFDKNQDLVEDGRVSGINSMRLEM